MFVGCCWVLQPKHFVAFGCRITPLQHPRPEAESSETDNRLQGALITSSGYFSIYRSRPRYQDRRSQRVCFAATQALLAFLLYSLYLTELTCHSNGQPVRKDSPELNLHKCFCFEGKGWGRSRVPGYCKAAKMLDFLRHLPIRKPELETPQFPKPQTRPLTLKAYMTRSPALARPSV